jgi:acetyl-CoA carboxylase biotin carboxyl carrier protein
VSNDEVPRSEAVDDADRATIARLASDVVPTLIDRLARSELGELEVREQGWRIRLRRPGYVNGHADTSATQPAQHAAARNPGQQHGEPRSTHREPRSAHREPSNVITSPAVGYFSPRDGVGISTSVRRGDVIGHVDVLGVRVDVVAGSDGLLAALEVESGQAVEYGEPIARVEPALSTHSADV